MRHLSPFKHLTFVLVLILGCATAFSAAAEPATPVVPPDPATYLCDAPDAPGLAPALAEPWASRLTGSVRLNEDDKTHSFSGRLVLMNDKIVAVLEADSPGLAVYSRQTRGSKLVARLHPICDDHSDMKRSAISIKENSRSTLSIEVAFRSPNNEPRQVTYELNAGEPFIKTTAGAGVQRLRVEAPCRFAVLPDFFADDIVVDAAAIPVARAEIPSENFLLHMMHGGEAILMTVSESRDNDIVVQLSGDSSRQIVSSDIFFGNKPRIWVSVLAGEGIWHERAVSPDDAGNVMRLEWQMPFAALWRVDWTRSDKLTESWEMLLQDSAGKYVMQNWLGQKESEGQNFGAGIRRPRLEQAQPAEVESSAGQLQIPMLGRQRSFGVSPAFRATEERPGNQNSNVCRPRVLLYPIDRVQAAPFATPLDQFTVVDLVRMTLGVGPCQYILDLEGQKRNSRGVATCYARDVINSIYKEGSQLHQGPAIQEHLDLCVAFIRNVRERIDQYVQFGHEMTAYLEEQKRLQPRHADFLNEMLAVTARLDLVFVQHREKIRTPADAQQNADEFRTSLLTYAGKDAYQKCAAQMSAFTSIGGAQDETVADCRMIVKTLRQRAGMAMAVDPELKDLATEIRHRTQIILRKATAYEAPRH